MIAVSTTDVAVALLRFASRPRRAFNFESMRNETGDAAMGIEQLIPENENKPFDMHAVISRIIDADSFWEVKALWAKEIITGFARLNGKPVGIVAYTTMLYNL